LVGHGPIDMHETPDEVGYIPQTACLLSLG
jgi:hypothetical protein